MKNNNELLIALEECYSHFREQYEEDGPDADYEIIYLYSLCETAISRATGRHPNQDQYSIYAKTALELKELKLNNR